jgi:nitrous oxidase accessory protein
MALPVMAESVAAQPPDNDVHRISADELAAATAAAAPGDTIIVDGGVHFGGVVIDKPLHLRGENWPVIDGENSGTVLKVVAPGTTISGFIIRHSGDSLDQENAGIAVEAAETTLEGNRFEDTLFGIYLADARGSIIRDNVILSKDLDVARRGDPIRVWDSDDVLIEGNTVTRGRDVVLWYSERLTLRDNVISDGRYGLHFMYCDDAIIEHNQLLDNSVGAYLMYSRRLNMRYNTVAYNRGPSGYGIGLKDVDEGVVIENLFLDNRVGAYIDGSPREVDGVGRFEGNVFAYNDTGIAMLPAVRHNHFSHNSFVENEEQVGNAGGGELRENFWSVNGQGNYWSDYAGYDADGDQIGDLVYRSERLFENLMQQEPNLRLFMYSPATSAIDFAARAFPSVRPQPKLVDEAPLTAPRLPALAPLLPQQRNPRWILAAVLMLAAAAGLAWLPRWGARSYRLDSQGVTMEAGE